MKIIAATMRGGLDDNVSQVFGRCSNYTIIKAEGSEIKEVNVVPNQAVAEIAATGIEAAEFIWFNKPEFVVAGNFGPHATAVFSSAGIKMIQAQGIVDDVVKKILSGELIPIDRPTVDLNYGASHVKMTRLE